MRAKILNASAGSGKTYQLAYKYVRDVIDQPGLYRHILAVTFTNKATEEMKSRILKEIHRLASGGASPYLGNLCRELSLDERSVRKRAAEVRSKILHDYSRFTVLTIDTFFQRILRAFIKELGIDLNYNVEIETASVLSKGADKSRLCIPISNYTGADDENGGPPGWLESKMSYEPAFDANIVLEDLLGVLTKREADIIRCHFIWGYGTRRIARILNVSESAVSKSKRRALEKLKAYIIEQDKALKNT